MPTWDYIPTTIHPLELYLWDHTLLEPYPPGTIPPLDHTPGTIPHWDCTLLGLYFPWTIPTPRDCTPTGTVPSWDHTSLGPYPPGTVSPLGLYPSGKNTLLGPYSPWTIPLGPYPPRTVPYWDCTPSNCIPPDRTPWNHKSGRYTSHWNALLFYMHTGTSYSPKTVVHFRLQIAQFETAQRS